MSVKNNYKERSTHLLANRDSDTYRYVEKSPSLKSEGNVSPGTTSGRYVSPKKTSVFLKRQDSGTFRKSTIDDNVRHCPSMFIYVNVNERQYSVASNSSASKLTCVK